MGLLYNLARVTTATTGTGTITLGAAVSGYLTFALAGASNGDIVSYGIKDGSNSEVGIGTYTSAGTTLTRTVTKSTNSNAAINLSGSAEVFITARAEDLQHPLLLNTLTASSSATLSDTTSFTAVFSAYELIFENILPATNGVTLELQVQSGGTFQTTSYVSAWWQVANSNFTPSTGNVTTFVQLSTANDVANTGGGISGQVRIYTPSGTTNIKAVGGHMFGQGAGSARYGFVSAYWNNSAAVTGFQVLFSSGNIASGVIKVYGIP